MPKILLFDLVDETPQLLIRDLPATDPGPGDVRYRVHAIGLNRADILYMQGGHYTAATFPTRIGYEASGVVDAIGPGVSGFKPGDRVAAIPFGDPKYCVAGEFAITPARFLSRWTEGHSAVEAAGTWMQYMTAYFPLKEIASVGGGDSILITAASSSAGLGAIQLGRLLRATVIASTRTRQKADFLLAAGADCVVVTSEGDVARRILEFTGGAGVSVVYDAVAGPFMGEYADAVANKARIFVYGAMGGKPTIECPILPLIRKGATIELYSLINYARDSNGIDRGREFLSRALETRAIRPIIDRVFRFEEAREAYAYMESGTQKGKIVLTTELGRAE